MTSLCSSYKMINDTLMMISNVVDSPSKVSFNYGISLEQLCHFLIKQRFYLFMESTKKKNKNKKINKIK